jgi:hypothetical protein
MGVEVAAARRVRVGIGTTGRVFSTETRVVALTMMTLIPKQVDDGTERAWMMGYSAQVLHEGVCSEHGC